MPLYVYEVLDRRGRPTGETFEILQSMKDPALTKHPRNGKPVRRAILAPNIAGKWTDLKGKAALSNSNLERLGFTKYERRGQGYMERTAGKQGPRALHTED